MTHAAYNALVIGSNTNEEGLVDFLKPPNVVWFTKNHVNQSDIHVFIGERGDDRDG